MNHISLRYKYKFADNAYVALGAGKYSDKRYYDGYYYTSYLGDYSETLYGILFGIITNDFTTFEFGYGQRVLPSGESLGMVTLSSGIHYYF